MNTQHVTLIFPDQLFENHPSLSKECTVILAEEYLYFKNQPYHKQRLILLRASMKAYEDYLLQAGYKVLYIESKELHARGTLFSLLDRMGIQSLRLSEFNDEWLNIDLMEACRKFKWHLVIDSSPMFTCSRDEINTFFKGKSKFSMAQFYSNRRKELNILMDDGVPLGGKFSFDSENRKRLPKGYRIPPAYIPESNEWVREATLYVDRFFRDSIGSSTQFYYPVTFRDARAALSDFIHNRLYDFGPYEDAIKKGDSFLFHSLLSPLLNIGLLTPDKVIKTVIELSELLSIPLNSLEGFVRQIIGWREFIRACYLLKGNKQRTSNFFGHYGTLPKGFWDGSTGIEPVDQTIKKILKFGYCHHIERLMILGNFLLLTETDPNCVYDWFMSFFVDAYDWVMVSNVYGMSQYADGGEMTTKPYISGSNYILKMSDYTKSEWVDIWDGLFWRFLSKHDKLFGKNPRTKVLLNHLIKNRDSIEKKIRLAEIWLKGAR